MESLVTFFNESEGVNCRVTFDQNGKMQVINDGTSDVPLPSEFPRPSTGTGGGGFLAEIELDSGSWDFTEQKQEAGGFSDLAGGRNRRG